MSIASYRRNVKRRVAGPHLPVCMPASLEQITPHRGYRPSVYHNHQEYLEWMYSIPYKQRDNYLDEQAEAMQALYRPLGIDIEDVVFKRVNTPLSFIRTAGVLLRDGYRVVVDVTYSGSAKNGTHAIGLIPTGEEGHVMTVSNHVQKALQGIVTLQQISKHVAFAPDVHYPDYPFSDANVTALPPVG